MNELQKNNDEIQKWFMSMGFENPYAATINMITNNIEVAPKHLRHFKNRYRIQLKRRYKNIAFIPVLEFKPHLHYHLILDKPTEITHDKFKQIFHDTISKTKHTHNNYNDIKPIKELDRWVGYITKFKNYNDMIDLYNLER